MSPERDTDRVCATRGPNLADCLALSCPHFCPTPTPGEGASDSQPLQPKSCRVELQVLINTNKACGPQVLVYSLAMDSDPDTARLEEVACTMSIPDRLVEELRSGSSSDAEIADVLEAFLLSIQPNAARQWLENPVPALEGQTPAHLINTGGPRKSRTCSSVWPAEFPPRRTTLG